MVDPMASDSNTQQGLHGGSAEECWFSSLESSNQDGKAAAGKLPESSDCKSSEQQTGSSSKGPSPSDPAAVGVNCEILPLSGNPFFTTIVSKSCIQNPYRLTIPRHFHQFLPNELLPVVLYCRDKHWKMKYYGDRSLRRFDDAGWRKFANDNKLKIGDGCVFELVDGKKLQFNVQILSGEIPSALQEQVRSSEFADGMEGEGSDTPIVID